jgi:hypothetical protein
MGIIGLVGLFTLTLAMPAVADHGQFTATGTVTAGNPATFLTGGVSEIFGECDPNSSFNGVDGIWYDIQGFGAHTATLTMNPDADFDAYWYDETCTFIEDFTMAQNSIGVTETAPVPATARFVVVDMFLGTNGTFTLTIN